MRLRLCSSDPYELAVLGKTRSAKTGIHSLIVGVGRLGLVLLSDGVV